MYQKQNVLNCYNKVATKYADQFFGELAYKPLDRIMLSRFAADTGNKGKVAFYAIVHFNDSELAQALEEIHRVSKIGGQFLFSFHTEEQILEVDNLLEEKVEVNFHFFDIDKVIEAVKNCGWRVVDAFVRHPYEGKEYPTGLFFV